jgi:hypothetical protein
VVSRYRRGIAIDIVEAYLFNVFEGWETLENPVQEQFVDACSGHGSTGSSNGQRLVDREEATNPVAPGSMR